MTELATLDAEKGEAPWFADVNESWPRSPLKARLKESDRRSTDGSETLLSVTEHRGVVRRESIVEEGDHLTRAESLEGYKIAEPGDLVVNIMLAWKRGLGVAEERGIVSPAYAVFRIRDGDVDPRFLNYLMRSDEAVALMKSHSYGIVDSRLRIYPDVLLGLKLPMPRLPEQQAIASFLDRETARIDTLIEKKRRLLDLLEEKRTALITRAVTRGLDPDVPMKDTGVEWIGEIPEHWEIRQARYLCMRSRPIIYGIVLPGPDVPEGVPLIKGGDVDRHELHPGRLNRTAFEIEAQHTRSRVNPGDVVYSIRGSFGAAAIVPASLEGANITQDAARLSPRGSVNAEWLSAALTSGPLKAIAEAGALGATIKGVNIRDLRRLPVPTPPPDEQNEIAEFLTDAHERLDGTEDRIRRAIRLLGEYRTALISAAVTGKIEPRERTSDSLAEPIMVS